MDIDSMIGEPVTHTSFGDGIIHSVGGKAGSYYICVAFSETEKLCKFMFPSIFTEMKMLSTTSAAILDIIKSITEGEYLCSICGKRRKSIISINHRDVCPICVRNAVECDSCKKPLLPNDAIFTIEPECRGGRKKYICKECAPKYRRCEQCGTVFNLNHRIDEFPQISPDLGLCISCTDDISNYCRCCGEYYLLGDLVTVEDSAVCKNCFKSNTMVCKKCGKTAILEREDRTIDGLCQDCEREEIYRDYVLSKMNSDCYRERIGWYSFKEAHSIPIMTRIRNNKGVLLVDFYSSIVPTLIIVYDMPGRCWFLIRESCTATELKKMSPYYIRQVDSARRGETIQLADGQNMHIWKNPYRLKAVTYSDMDFRKEWRNGVLEYEGNNYGDTSDFYIVGTLGVE